MSESEKSHKLPENTEKTETVTTDSGQIQYTARAGWILLRDKEEQPAAEMFHVAYIKDSKEESNRPITFIFNGGPGAASAYLHLGAMGPKRVVFESNGVPGAPPVTLEDNAESWLDFTDLVFVDPVGTGFSRTVNKKDQTEEGDDTKKESSKSDASYYGVKSDLEALSEFIIRYLSENHRWLSPVFIAGESYGGFRVGKLAKLLQEGYGVGLNGAVILSPALEFTLLDPSDYDVLHWIDVFPSMAAAAAYHGRSGIFSTDTNLQEILDTSQDFAVNKLYRLLTLGGALPEESQRQIIRQISKYLGLPLELVRQSQGRISPARFARHLLQDSRMVCGMYDATVTAIDPFPDRETYQGPDPTLFGIERHFASGINARLRKDLGVKTDRIYNLLSMDVNKAWKIDTERHALDSQMGATDDLRYGMSINPHMKVFISHGFYDLVTPYFSSTRLRNLMRLDNTLSENLTMKHFPGGHMFYTWDSSRKELKEEMKHFYSDAVPHK